MIAAASVIAKVSRDRHMVKLDKVYPQYGFARHKATAPGSTSPRSRSTAPARSTGGRSIGHFVTEIEEEKAWESG